MPLQTMTQKLFQQQFEQPSLTSQKNLY